MHFSIYTFRSRCKTFIRKRTKKLKLWFSLPHLWVSIIIFLMSLIAIGWSVYLNYIENDYWSSMLANIGGGLLTGLILCLVSGIKQFSIARLRSKEIFLNNIKSKIAEYDAQYCELYEKPFCRHTDIEGLFDFIYETGSLANWVNEYILQASFDELWAVNPREYCKRLGYDAYALTDKYEALHQNLYLIDVNNPSKKEILSYFDDVNTEQRQLNRIIYHELKVLALKIETINRTII